MRAAGLVLLVSAVAACSASSPPPHSVIPSPTPSVTVQPSSAQDKQTPWSLGIHRLPAGVCYPDTSAVRINKHGDGRLVSADMARYAAIGGYAVRKEDRHSWVYAYSADAGDLGPGVGRAVAVAYSCGIGQSNGYFSQIVVLTRGSAGTWRTLDTLAMRERRGVCCAGVDTMRIMPHRLVVRERAVERGDAKCCPKAHLRVVWFYRGGRFVPSRGSARLHSDGFVKS